MNKFCSRVGMNLQRLDVRKIPQYSVPVNRCQDPTRYSRGGSTSQIQVDRSRCKNVTSGALNSIGPELFSS